MLNFIFFASETNDRRRRLQTVAMSQGGGGSTPACKWRRWSKDFFGFEIFDSGFFLGLKIWQVFLGDFFGVLKSNLSALAGLRVLWYDE